MPGRRFADCNDDLSRTIAIISTAGARRQVLFAASYPAPGVPGQRRSSVRRPASRAPRSARRRVCACYLMRMSDANQHSITLFDGLGRVQSESEAGGWPPVPAAAVLHQPMLTRCLRNEIGIPPCTDIDPVAGEFRGHGARRRGPDRSQYRCRVPRPASAPPQTNSPSDEGRDIVAHLRGDPHYTGGAVAAGAPHCGERLPEADSDYGGGSMSAERME